MSYYDEVISHFGNKNRTAIACGMARSSIDYWEEKDFVPDDKQILIFNVTKGLVKPEKRVADKYKVNTDFYSRGKLI